MVAVVGGSACRLCREATSGAVLAVGLLRVAAGRGVGAGKAGCAVGRGVASSGVEVAAGPTCDARGGTLTVLVLARCARVAVRC